METLNIEQLSKDIAEEMELTPLQMLRLQFHLQNVHHDGWLVGFDRCSTIASNAIDGNEKKSDIIEQGAITL